MNTYLLYCAIAFYLVSTCFYFVTLITGKSRWERTAQTFFLVGFAMHLISLVLRLVKAGYAPVTNIHESLSFFALCIAGFFLYCRRVYKVRALGGLILPLLSVMLLWSLTFPTEIRPLVPALNNWLLPIHVLLSFLGNAVFVITFFVSILYLIVERGIKKKRTPVSDRLPSLETLDLINYRCMSYGFPLLTAGIITGSIWAGFAWGSYWNWDPKETWSLITWIVYAILIHNRLTMGWRGRKTAYMMILGFFSILFTFLGVNFILKGLHSYV